jgi:fucose permease
MPRYHAVWSVGGFTFAGVGAALSHWHVPIPLHFAGYSVLAIITVFVCLSRFFDERPAAEQERAQHAAAGTASTGSRLALARHLIPLGIVMGAATLIEGAASDWLGIYFNTDRGTSPAAGSAAFTLFSVSMAAARAAGTWAIEKFGRAQAVRLGGLTSLVGVALLLLSPTVGPSYAGAALWGLGVAIIFPAVVSAAGDTPGRAAEAISLVTPIGYSGFLFGPPAIGLIAHALGLNIALWLVGLLALVTVALAGRTREPDRLGP